MRDKKLVKTVRKRGLGFQEISCFTHGYVLMNKQKVENVTGAVNTRNNRMFHIR